MPAIAVIVCDHLTATFAITAAAIPPIKSGKLRGIAYSGQGHIACVRSAAVG
jgi:hypothetical protein